MSIYKNERGRAVMADWYQRFVDGLAEPVEFVRVDTRAGSTNVLLTGPVDAPPLLCFHGVMGSAPSALSLIERLVPSFRVVFPDTVGQPGRSAETSLPLRGDAYAHWAVDVLDGLHLDRVRCLGVSMGGYIALKLAQTAPERLAALSLWVPGGLVSTAKWDGARLGLYSLLAYLFPGEARMRRLFDELFTDHDDTWFAFYSDSQSVLKMDRRMPQLAPDDAFTGLTAPVQLFANENDVLFPAGPLIERARQVFPNLVEADVLRGYKHVPPFAAGATDAVLDRIRTFLLDAGSAAPSHG